MRKGVEERWLFFNSQKSGMLQDDLYLIYEPNFGPDEVFAGYELLHPSRDYVIIIEGNITAFIGDETF